MSTIREKVSALLSKVGLSLSEEQAPETNEIVLAASAKLQDGTEVYTTGESFAVGGDVYSKSETGEPLAAPAGEYTFEDGTVIVVGDDSKIAEVKEAAQADPEMTSEEVVQAMETLSAEYEKLKDELVTLRTNLAAISEAKKLADAELAAKNIEVTNLKKQAATNSVTEVEKLKLKKEIETPKKSWNEMTPQERLASLRTQSN